MLAVSTDTATQNIGAILGPLVFAAVVWTSGLNAAFVALTIAMIPGAIIPLFLRVQGRAEGAPAGTTIRRTIDGFVYTWRHTGPDSRSSRATSSVEISPPKVRRSSYATRELLSSQGASQTRADQGGSGRQGDGLDSEYRSKDHAIASGKSPRKPSTG
jgi:hypothetical protein